MLAGVTKGHVILTPTTNRAQLACRGDSVLLRSRQGTDMTAAFPEIRAAALAQLPEQTGLDGELVVWESGRHCEPCSSPPRQ